MFAGEGSRVGVARNGQCPLPPYSQPPGHSRYALLRTAHRALICSDTGAGRCQFDPDGDHRVAEDVAPARPLAGRLEVRAGDRDGRRGPAHRRQPVAGTWPFLLEVTSLGLMIAAIINAAGALLVELTNAASWSCASSQRWHRTGDLSPAGSWWLHGGTAGASCPTTRIYGPTL